MSNLEEELQQSKYLSSGSLDYCVINAKLQNSLPSDFLRINDTEHTTIDKIVTVCAALTNNYKIVGSFLYDF